MNSQDDFRARVEALVAEGKLTAEEAQQLLAGGSGVRVTSETPEDRTPRRLTIRMQGASVQVYPDAGLSAPQVSTEGEGKVELVSTAEGWLLRRDPQEEHWLGRLMGGLFREGLKIELRVPQDFRDLDLDLAGGNIRLHDLGARVTAKVTGGNLNVGRVTALNVNVTGGNLSGTADFEAGDQHIKITGGNATLSVLNAPEVRLSAHVVGGSIRTHGFLVRRRDTSPATTRLETEGSGQTQLHVSITGGSATLNGEERSAAPRPLEQGEGGEVRA